MNELNTTKVAGTTKRGRPPKAASREEQVKAKRPARIPLDGSRTRLALEESKLDPAFKYKWVNDVGDKIARYQNAYYEHVSGEEGLEIGQRCIDSSTGEVASVVSRDGGNHVQVYLMKIPIEYAMEDKAAKEALTEKRAEALKQSLNSGQEGMYGEVKFGQ
jgi:hypothetical protein